MLTIINMLLAAFRVFCIIEIRSHEMQGVNRGQNQYFCTLNIMCYILFSRCQSDKTVYEQI